MTAQRQQIEGGIVFDMAACFVNVASGGSARVHAGTSRHPNLAGAIIDAPEMSRHAPHGGELRPDGDGPPYVISDHREVHLCIPPGPDSRTHLRTPREAS